MEKNRGKENSRQMEQNRESVEINEIQRVEEIDRLGNGKTVDQNTNKKTKKESSGSNKIALKEQQARDPLKEETIKR